jgi:hypothetical protein
MFRKKARLILIYKFVSNKIIINIFINYSLHNFTNTTYVPQGSVIDPLLFLVYINDIGEKLLSLSRLFADDTSLGYSSQNVIEIENVINHD